MNNTIKYEKIILIFNGLERLFGNLIKIFSYLFHFVFPHKRFTIPKFSPAIIKRQRTQRITRTIWQTNYSNQVSLPVYCNYLFNRLLSLNYDYCYVSTEEREEFIRNTADQRTFDAYSKLTDGASQADFWRIFVLYHKGGIYIDIDGHLVWNLDSIINKDDHEVLIKRRNQYTNFFMASEKGNPFLKSTLDIIIDNIENRRIDGGVFKLTGPVCLNQALLNESVNFRRDKLTCAQGTFTNEYFQYIDKKLGKWNHAKNEDLLK